MIDIIQRAQQRRHIAEQILAEFTLLELKERRQANPTLECPSIDLYRAVLEDGVRTEEDLQIWLNDHPTGLLTPWHP